MTATEITTLREDIAEIINENIEEDEWYQESETEGFYTYRITDHGLDLVLELLLHHDDIDE